MKLFLFCLFTIFVYAHPSYAGEHGLVYDQSSGEYPEIYKPLVALFDVEYFNWCTTNDKTGYSGCSFLSSKDAKESNRSLMISTEHVKSNVNNSKFLELYVTSFKETNGDKIDFTDNLKLNENLYSYSHKDDGDLSINGFSWIENNFVYDVVFIHKDQNIESEYLKKIEQIKAKIKNGTKVFGKP